MFHKNDKLMLQIFDSVLSWTAINNMQIVTPKTKEMIFGSLGTANLPLLSTSAGWVERVYAFKLLRLSFDASLSWSVHGLLLPPKPANVYISWNSSRERGFLPYFCILRHSNSPCSRILHPSLALCHHSITGWAAGVDIKACYSHYLSFYSGRVIF